MGLGLFAAIAVLVLVVVFTFVYVHEYNKANHLLRTQGTPISQQKIFKEAITIDFIFGAAMFVAEVEAEARANGGGDQDVEADNSNDGGGGGGDAGVQDPVMDIPAMPTMGEDPYQGPVESEAVDPVLG